MDEKNDGKKFFLKMVGGEKNFNFLCFQKEKNDEFFSSYFFYLFNQ